MSLPLGSRGWQVDLRRGGGGLGLTEDFELGMEAVAGCEELKLLADLFFGCLHRGCLSTQGRDMCAWSEGDGMRVRASRSSL